MVARKPTIRSSSSPGLEEILLNSGDLSDGPFIAASVMTALGDLIYADATPAPARVPGYTVAGMAALTQTGTGSASAPPAWTPVDSAATANAIALRDGSGGLAVGPLTATTGLFTGQYVTISRSDPTTMDQYLEFSGGSLGLRIGRAVNSNNLVFSRVSSGTPTTLMTLATAGGLTLTNTLTGIAVTLTGNLSCVQVIASGQIIAGATVTMIASAGNNAYFILRGNGVAGNGAILQHDGTNATLRTVTNGSLTLGTNNTVRLTISNAGAASFSSTLSATSVQATSAGGFISSDSSAGISTTITTASLVGKTITVKDGIITSFA